MAIPLLPGRASRALLILCIAPHVCSQGEVFCHRYYLKHLCDEQRHAGWPLADHIQLLQASERLAQHWAGLCWMH